MCWYLTAQTGIHVGYNGVSEGQSGNSVVNVAIIPILQGNPFWDFVFI